MTRNSGFLAGVDAGWIGALCHLRVAPAARLRLGPEDRVRFEPQARLGRELPLLADMLPQATARVR